LRTGSRPGSATCSNWPLTGGVPSQLSTVKGAEVNRVYFVGYSDGSVLVCDATHPVLSYICYVEGEVIIPQLFCPQINIKKSNILTFRHMSVICFFHKSHVFAR